MLKKDENFLIYEDSISPIKPRQHVLLTVEEASEVWDSLVNLVSYAEPMEGSLSDLVRDGQRNIDLIRNRIKKAEKANETER